MNLHVRQASVHDLDTVAALFNAYRRFYGQPGDLERARAFLRERFAHHESVILLACDDSCGAPGFTQLYPLFSSVRCARTYLLNDLFVLPSARRQGVGTRLLTAAAAFARANGATSLSLSTAVDNTAAQKLYEALGWKRDSGFFEYHLSLEDTSNP
jgi:ribosomal protein S18 acetylase RimI-like enzyme